MIGARPAPLLPQKELLTSTACTFLRRLLIIVFGSFFKTCAPLRREAPFGSPGLYPCGRNRHHAPTACKFQRRRLILIFGRFQKTCALLRREAYLGSPGCYLWGPRPLSGGSPKRHPGGTLRMRSGSSGVVSWKPPGPLWEASRPPKAVQG